MVDIAAAMTRKIATAFKDIEPSYADWLNICADAKEENERLREALETLDLNCDCETDVGCNNDFATDKSNGLVYCDCWVAKCALNGKDWRTTRHFNAALKGNK